MKRVLVCVAAVLLVMCAAMASAQGAPADVVNPSVAPASISFSASSEAVAFYNHGAWTAGNDTTEILTVAQFGKLKTQTLSVTGKEIVASDFTTYLGGFRFEPDVSSFLEKHTAIPKNSLAVFFDAGVGNTLYSDTSAVTWLAGGGLRYALTSTGSLQWTTVTADYMRYGNTNVAKLSTGLQYYFRR